MSIVRRLVVVLCILAGGWAGWTEEAPDETEWLQFPLDYVHMAFDEVELTPPLARAFVGAGAGAIVAFLLCGGLWRPLRFFSMLLLVGAGAGGGWYLATEAPTDWLVREFQVEGLIPTMLVCGAAAALLLGVYDLLRPGSAGDATTTRSVSVFRLLVVPAFVAAAGWLAWGEEAPTEAEWLQPTLDQIHGAFDRVPLEPRWARALAGGGAAGLIAFILGGALWKPGRFVAMLFVLGAGATAGWSMTNEPLTEWATATIGIEGLVPLIVLGLSGAGLLLGLVEWLRPVDGAADAWTTLVHNQKAQVSINPGTRRMRVAWSGNSVEMNYEPLSRDPATLVGALARIFIERGQTVDMLSEEDYENIFRAIQTRGPVSGKIGLVVPPGRFTAQLTSSSDEDYDRAVNDIEAVTQKGDRSGLEEIEAIIKANAPRGATLEFHQPGMRMFAGGFNAPKIIAKFVGFAKGKGVLAHAKEIQLEMSQLAMFGKLPEAMMTIQQAAGAKERRCFQLLYEQLRMTAVYLKAK